MTPVEEQAMIRGKYIKDRKTISEISRELGLDRKTVRKYIQMEKVQPHQRRRARGTILDPYKDYINGQLQQWPLLSAKKLYRKVKTIGFDGSYSVVKRYVRTIRRKYEVLAEYRYETLPGEQSQVDWGYLGKQFIDGKERKVYVFCMILGYSRMRYIEVTTDLKTETFIQCHINAFEFYKGYTKTILYDNTKNVVLERALHGPDSKFNPMFVDLFDHYGFVPILCKPGQPGAKTKGKVEALVKYTKNDFYMGEEFGSLPEMNQRAREWMERVNSEPHGTTHIPPVDRFPEEDLLPIDEKTPFQIVKTEYRKIARDCFITYMTNRYSIPWKYAGREAKLIIVNDKMKIHVNDLMVCEHEIHPGRNSMIRVKEHHAGLYSARREENQRKHEEHIEKLALSVEEPKILHNGLERYDMLIGVIP